MWGARGNPGEEPFLRGSMGWGLRVSRIWEGREGYDGVYENVEKGESGVRQGAVRARNDDEGSISS